MRVVNSRAGDVARESTQAGDLAVAATINAGLQLLTPQAAGQQIRGGTDTSSLIHVRDKDKKIGLDEMVTIPVMLLQLILLLDFPQTLLFHTVTDRSQERLQISQEILLRDTSLPVQQEEQLTLHQVHLGQREAKSVKSFDSSIPSPMLVLRTRVIQVFGGEDQRSKEDPVDSASHALGDGWQAGPEAAQVHEGTHQGGHLDLRPGDE